MRLVNFVRADFLKMRGLSLGVAHLVIPLLMNGIFLAYYSYSGWDVNTKICAFFQAMGCGYPILIGIFTATVAEQEQNAGNCQNMLALKHRTAAFMSKFLFLIFMGAFSVGLTTLIFSLGFEKLLGNTVFDMTTYVIIALVVWCSSIPLYVWHLFLAFRLGRGASIGFGITEGLITTLFLTGMGDFIWKYVPGSWTGRIPYTYLAGLLESAEHFEQLRNLFPGYVIVTAGGIVCYLFWAVRWEGSRLAE